MGFDNVCSIIKKQIERALSLQIPSYLPFLIHGTSAGVFAYAARCCLLSPSARIPFRVCITPESLPNPTCADGGLELCERKEVLEWRYFPSIQSIALATVTPSLLPSPKRSSVSTILFADKSRAFSSGDSSRSRVCSSNMLALTWIYSFSSVRSACFRVATKSISALPIFPTRI